MPRFLDKLLKILQGRRGKDMRFCAAISFRTGESLSDRPRSGIINTYAAMGLDPTH